MKPSEILEGALAQFVDPADHCRNHGTRLVDGRVQKCADYALVDTSTDYKLRQRARSFLLGAGTVCTDVVKFNDSHTHEEVVALFRAGIQRAKEAGE